MSSALATIADRVRERVRIDGVDLAADSGLAESYVRDEVRRYSERALGGSVPLLVDEAQAAREIVATLTGFGPLQRFFDDPTVEELWINAPDGVLANSTEAVSEKKPSDNSVGCEVWCLVHATSSARLQNLDSNFVSSIRTEPWRVIARSKRHPEGAVLQWLGSRRRHTR